LRLLGENVRAFHNTINPGYDNNLSNYNSSGKKWRYFNPTFPLSSGEAVIKAALELLKLTTQSVSAEQN